MEQAFREKSEVRELADLHHCKEHTPTMGGLIIVLSTVLGSIPFIRWNLSVKLVYLNFLTMALVGLLDDGLKVFKHSSRGIPGKMKLLVQLILAGVTFFYMSQSMNIYDVWFPWTKEYSVWSGVLVFLLYFFVLAGTSNAVNLTDGLDGLAAGCTIPVAVTLGILSLIVQPFWVATKVFSLPFVGGAGELAVMTAALVGSCVVFLWYNGHPASIFMGDTGSLAIGALLGSVALVIKLPFFLPIVGGIFVLEALSVILQVASFKLFHRRIIRMAPIHHHFELGGTKETKIVMHFWIVSLFLSLLTLSIVAARCFLKF